MKLVLAAALFCVSVAAYTQESKPIEATTPTGEKVLLHPNGRWEYVDRVKQEAAKRVADTFRKTSRARRRTGWMVRLRAPDTARRSRLQPWSLSGKGRLGSE